MVPAGVLVAGTHPGKVCHTSPRPGHANRQRAPTFVWVVGMYLIHRSELPAAYGSLCVATLQLAMWHYVPLLLQQCKLSYVCVKWARVINGLYRLKLPPPTAVKACVTSEMLYFDIWLMGQWLVGLFLYFWVCEGSFICVYWSALHWMLSCLWVYQSLYVLSCQTCLMRGKLTTRSDSQTVWVCTKFYCD